MYVQCVFRGSQVFPSSSTIREGHGENEVLMLICLTHSLATPIFDGETRGASGLRSKVMINKVFQLSILFL